MGGCGRGFHQQANQLTTQPPSLGINPQTWWESISGSPPHKSISLFSRTRRFSTEASLPCEQSPLLPQPPRFYLHLARNSRFPSRLNLLLSFSRSSAGISPCGWFRKGWIKYSWQRREAETFQKSQFLRQDMKTHFQQKNNYGSSNIWFHPNLFGELQHNWYFKPWGRENRELGFFGQ